MVSDILWTLPQIRDQILDSKIGIYFDHFPDKNICIRL